MSIKALKRAVDNSDGLDDNESVNIVLKMLRGAVSEILALEASEASAEDLASMKVQVRSLEDDLRVAVDERDRVHEARLQDHEDIRTSQIMAGRYMELRDVLDKMLEQWMEWAKTKELDPLVMTLHITSLMIAEQAKWVEPQRVG